MRAIRRGIAALLSAAILLLSPGLEATRAFAAEVTSKPGLGSLPALTAPLSAAPSAVLPSLGVGALPSVSVQDAGVDVQGALPTLPAPAEAAAMPATAPLASAAVKLSAPSALSASSAVNRAPAASAAVNAPAPAPVASAAGVQEAVIGAARQLARPELGAESAHGVGLGLEAALVGGGPAKSEGADAVKAPDLMSGALKAGPAKAPSRLGRWVKRGLAAAGLSAMLLMGSDSATRPVPAPTPAAVMAPAAAAPSVAPAAVVQDGKVHAYIALERQGGTVGDRIGLELVLDNQTDKPVAVSGLAASLQAAFGGADVEVKGVEAPTTLAPGESRSILFEVVAFDSGELKLADSMKVVTSEGEITVALPETVLSVKTVLTPDWKQKGFRGISPVIKREQPRWVLAAGLLLFITLLVGVERLLAARRAKLKARAARPSALEAAGAALAALERGLPTLAAPEFYARLTAIEERFLVDQLGLRTIERTPARLLADLKASGGLTDGQLEIAAELAQKSEAARLGGRETTPEERLKDLLALTALVGVVAGKGAASPEAGKDGGAGPVGMMGMFGLMPAAADLQFGTPWALALFIPLGFYLLWKLVNHRKSAAYEVSSDAALPAKKGFRARFAWLPGFLRVAALTFAILAVAGPKFGVHKEVTVSPSTDTMITVDLSGSMGDSFLTGDGSGPRPSKLEAAEGAITEYVIEQRRGTSNRVGLLTFADDPYLDIRLATDYDALISHLKELEPHGSTAIGKSILGSVAHFLEVNALELDGAADPRVAQMRLILKDKGLPAALEFLKPYPDLVQKVLQPERRKVVILFSDGVSTSGLDPIAAAKVAKDLGVRIYTVGIAPKGMTVVPGFDEKTMMGVAETTGGQYFRADDPERMRDVLLEINALEKSPVKVVTNIALKDYSRWFALLALLAFAAQIGLSNTRLRMLYGIMLIGIPLGGPSGLPAHAPAAQAVHAPALSAPVPELSEGNRLYNQGQPEEALKKYAEALEAHPELTEIYYNMGDAYLAMGDTARAEASFQRFLATNPEPRLASRAYYNLGLSAIKRQDGEQALALWKEALRRDPDNADAKWNLEVLKQLMKENPQNGKGKGKGPPKPGQPGGPPGQPGDQQGQQGVQDLSKLLGAQDKESKENADRRITRKGSNMWGLVALPAAFAGGSTLLTFASPLVLWILAFLLPVLAGLIAYGIKKRLKAGRALSPATAPKGFSSWWGRRRALAKLGLALGAAGLLGLAAADPRSGYKEERMDFGGKDLVVAVDGSHSMIFAEDGRLSSTKLQLGEFARRLQGSDRVGLVVFAGSARTAAPLSTDYSNFEFKIDRLEVEARGLKEGSKLAQAVRFSGLSALSAKDVGDRQRVLIIISDGDVDQGELDDAVKEAKTFGFVVYTIGVGAPQGTRMRVPGVDGGAPEYLVDDRTGAAAVTRLNEAPLQELAARTGGAYFKAGQGTTIDGIMEQVSELQNGKKGDVIRLPQSVASWFLWPALMMLLLDLLLKNKSTVKPEKAKDPKDEPVKFSSLWGLGFIPLSAWPLILPLALLTLVLGGVVLADLWTEGGIRRRLRWAWSARQGLVKRGLAADGAKLFDLRAADEASLGAFLASWTAAPEAGKAALMEQASADAELWSEKLAAAFIHANSPETQEELLGALTRASRAHLEPAAPAVVELVTRLDDLAWLSHPEAARRLAHLAAETLEPSAPEARAALERLARHPDAEVSAGPRLALGEARRPGTLRRASRTWAGRAGIAASVVVAAGLLTFAGASGVGTYEHAQKSAAEAKTAFEIFYGEDLYIFRDKYADQRIPDEALPPLRDWRAGEAERGADLDRSIRILSESLDPKADNVLEAIFKHADVLPLTDDGETLLLVTLMRRENPRLWRFMEEHISKTADNPAQVERLKKMIVIAANIGQVKAYENLYFFLKSPNPEIRGLAAKSIWGMITGPALREHFTELLAAAELRHAADPAINLWIERFLLMRLASPEGPTVDLSQARALIDLQLQAADLQSPKRAQALAALQPGEPIPTSSLEAMMGLMKKAAEASAAPDGTLPAPLAGIIRYGVSAAATRLIAEGEDIGTGLADQLKDEGVIPDEGIREEYKLSHLQGLRDVLARRAAQAAAAGPMAAPDAEYYTRADAALAAMLDAGKAAGLQAGDTLGERAAAMVGRSLKEVNGLTAFTIDLLRARGLAPAEDSVKNGVEWADSYTAADLKKLRGFLLELGAGKFGDLDGEDRKKVAAAVAAADRALRNVYPAEAGPERSFWQVLAEPGAEPLVLARLAAAVGAQSGDLEFQKQALAALLKRLQSPAGRRADADEAAEVLSAILTNGFAHGQGEAFLKTLSAALDRQGDEVLAPAARAAVRDLLIEVARQAEGAFPGLDAELQKAGIKYNAVSYRLEWRLAEIAALQRLIEAAGKDAAAAGNLSVEQTAVLSRARSLVPKALEAAKRADMQAGETAADKVAAPVNELLKKGYYAFYGSTFTEALKKAGLAPASRARYGSFGDNYYQRYTAEDLQRLKDFYKKLLASGNGWQDAKTRRPLDAGERRYLEESIAKLDELAQGFHGVKLHGLMLAGLAFSPLLQELAPYLMIGLGVAVLAALAARFVRKRRAAARAAAEAPAPLSSSVEERAKRLELAAGRLAGSFAPGAFRSAYIGPGGADFAEYRSYQAGDPVRDIDWKASARSEELQVKRHHLEKDMPLWLLVDLSASRRFGAAGTDKKTVIDDIAAILALAAGSAGLRVGAVLFTDKIEALIHPQGGRAHARSLAETIVSTVPAGKGTDLKGALEAALEQARSRAIVAVVSDFLAPDFRDSLLSVAARHDLRLVRVTDPAELKALPDVGLVRVRDAETGRARVVDTSNPALRAQLTALAAKRERELQAAFDHAGAFVATISTQGDSLDAFEEAWDPQGRKR